MRSRIARLTIPALAALAVATAGVAVAQSGSSPSGTPEPRATQPGSESRPSGAKQPAAAQAPEAIALIFYADWCPGCKALKPKLEEALASMHEQPCLFVKLDQTVKESHQAEYLLAALGLGDLWKEYAGKTGFVLLVDAKSHKVLETITSAQDVKEIKAALASAVGD